MGVFQSACEFWRGSQADAAWPSGGELQQITTLGFDLVQEGLDALQAAFEKASVEREAAGYKTDGAKFRAMLANFKPRVTLHSDNIRIWNQTIALRAALCYGYEQTTGRPRERWHITDCRARIDANAIRKQAPAEGEDPGAVKGIILNLDGEGEDEHTYRWTWWRSPTRDTTTGCVAAVPTMRQASGLSVPLPQRAEVSDVYGGRHP